GEQLEVERGVFAEEHAVLAAQQAAVALGDEAAVEVDLDRAAVAPLVVEHERARAAAVQRAAAVGEFAFERHAAILVEADRGAPLAAELLGGVAGERLVQRAAGPVPGAAEADLGAEALFAAVAARDALQRDRRLLAGEEVDVG